MNTFTTVFDEAHDPRNRHFYVPTFEIKIDGAGLPRGVLRDVTELSYQDDVTQIDNFQITVNNWDATARRCKYIGSETAAQLAQSNQDSLLFKLFEPCNKTVKLSLGYVDNLSPIMTGNFTTMEPNFPNSGPPVLTVRGLNILHRLRTKKFSHAWTNMTPSEIALDFNNLRDKGAPRIKPPWHIVTDPTAANNEKNTKREIEYVAQTDQFDVDFLLNLARMWSYELEVIEEQHQLRFGPSRTASKFVNYRLDWGKSLIEFTPTLSTANQWKSVTVRGWDRRSQKPISEPIDLDDPQLKKLNANLHEILQQCDPREQQVVDLPVFTRAEAKDRARAMLRDRLVQIVKAKGRTVGLPGLRAGTLVDIEQVGARLSGAYFVTKTTHTIGSGGYTTEFECRREDLGSKPRPGGT
jgi:phage protein D